jgi:hypothetical protein
MAFVDSLYIGLVILLRLLAISCKEAQYEKCSGHHHIFYTAYIWISDYLTSCLIFFNIVLEVYITLQRLLMISHHLPSIKNRTKVKLVSLVIFLLSFTAYIPVLFMKRVELKPEQISGLEIEQYQIVKTKFGKSEAAKIIMNSLNVSRVLLVSVLLLVLNSVTAHKFRRFLQRREPNFENYENRRSKFCYFWYLIFIEVIIYKQN